MFVNDHPDCRGADRWPHLSSGRRGKTPQVWPRQKLIESCVTQQHMRTRRLPTGGIEPRSRAWARLVELIAEEKKPSGWFASSHAS